MLIAAIRQLDQRPVPLRPRLAALSAQHCPLLRLRRLSAQVSHVVVERHSREMVPSYWLARQPESGTSPGLRRPDYRARTGRMLLSVAAFHFMRWHHRDILTLPKPTPRHRSLLARVHLRAPLRRRCLAAEARLEGNWKSAEGKLSRNQIHQPAKHHAEPQTAQSSRSRNGSCAGRLALGDAEDDGRKQGEQ